MSMWIASNFQEHIHEGLKVAMYVLHLPLLVVIPILLLLIAFVKNKKNKRDRAM